MNREYLDSLLSRPELKPLYEPIEGFEVSRLNIILQHMGYETSSEKNIVCAGFPLRKYMHEEEWNKSLFANMEPQTIPFICQSIHRNAPIDPNVKLNTKDAPQDFKRYLAMLKEREDKGLDNDGYSLDSWVTEKSLRNLAKYDFEAENIEDWVDDTMRTYSVSALQKKYDIKFMDDVPEEEQEDYFESVANTYISSI